MSWLSSHKRSRGRVLVLAPTGKADDVAVREGAGDSGYTITKALHMLRNNTLALTRWTLVIVDEVGMVGTDELRQLLTATTAAGTKTVLVGDAHQLAPVKAPGGMFAQLCTDLTWTQKLSEVWRLRDPEERSASLALRDGGPAPVHRAIGWYRNHDRLHSGDPIAMAHLAPATLYRQFYKARDAAGRPDLRFHDLRHSGAVLAAATGATLAEPRGIAAAGWRVNPGQKTPGEGVAVAAIASGAGGMIWWRRWPPSWPWWAGSPRCWAVRRWSWRGRWASFSPAVVAGVSVEADPVDELRKRRDAKQGVVK